jgi:hypothetical protein
MKMKAEADHLYYAKRGEVRLLELISMIPFVTCRNWASWKGCTNPFDIVLIVEDSLCVDLS